MDAGAGVHQGVVVAGRQLERGASVPGALEEIDARNRREALQLLDGECQRTVDQPVDGQRVLRRIDRRDAVVVALKDQIRWRDRAIQIVHTSNPESSSRPIQHPNELNKNTYQY